jgi:hypothetical protein
VSFAYLAHFSQEDAFLHAEAMPYGRTRRCPTCKTQQKRTLRPLMHSLIQVHAVSYGLFLERQSSFRKADWVVRENIQRKRCLKKTVRPKTCRLTAGLWPRHKTEGGLPQIRRPSPSPRSRIGTRREADRDHDGSVCFPRREKPWGLQARLLPAGVNPTLGHGSSRLHTHMHRCTRQLGFYHF